MIYCLRSSSRHAIQTVVSEPKINSLYPLMVSLDSFFKLFPCFHTISTRYIQLFCKLQQARLVHIFVVLETLGRLQKSFAFLLPLKKCIIIMTQHVALLFFCIGAFTLFNIYLRIIIFTLFVERINL